MWTYEEKPYTSEDLDDSYVGFVYEITDTVNGKKYIGKKKFISKRKKPPLKGMKRKRTVISESDWNDYYGSSEEVKALIEEHGTDRFNRVILRLCKNTGEMSYYEAKFQFERDVLLNPDEYYNAFIGLKVHRNHVKHLIGD